MGEPWVICAQRALPLCWWGCREGCRLGILKCGGEGGGESEGGGGGGGAIGEGDKVDNVFGALELWGADGALTVFSARGGEAVCHGYRLESSQATRGKHLIGRQILGLFHSSISPSKSSIWICWWSLLLFHILYRVNCVLLCPVVSYCVQWCPLSH